MADAKIVLSAVDQTKAAFDAAKKNMQSLGDQAGSLKGMFQALGVSLSAVAAVAWIKNIVNSLDALNDLSKSTGITVENLAGLSLLAKQSGTDLDGLAKGINKMSVEMGKDPAAFRALGITAKDNMQAFAQFSDVFNKLPDIQQRNALAQAVFGKSWAELAPALSEGSQKIQETIETGSRLSGISAIMTKEADELNDKWAQLTTTGGLVNQMVGAALPLFNSLADDLVKVQNGSKGASEEAGKLLGVMKFVTVVLGGFGFVATESARAVGLVAAQMGAMARGDLKGVIEMGRQWTEDVKRNTDAHVKWQEKIMAVRQATVVEAAAAKAAADAKAKISKAQQDAASKAAQAFIDRAKNEAGAAAELKKYTSALQQLEEQLGKLNNQTAAEKTLYQVTQGSLKDLTEEHKKSLLAKAKEVDIRLALIQVIDSEQAHLAALFEVMEKGNAIRRDASVSVREQIDQYQFETSLIGKTAKEQMLLNAERQIELGLRQQLKAAAENAGDNTEQYEKDRKALLASAAALRDGLLPAMRERLALEREWSTGAKSAFDEYIDHAGNAAEQSKNLWSNAFKGMEDALVGFVKTGKLDFASLADSIISDLIRIHIRQSMAQMMGGWNLFGMGSSAAVAGPGSGLGASDAMGSLSMMAAKGAAFDGPQAFAKGGSFTNSIVDSPTLFKFARGTGLMGEAGPEAIMPLSRGPDGSLGVRSSGGGNSMVVNIIGAPSTPQVEQRPDGNGGMTLDIIFEQVDGYLGGKIRAGRGVTAASLKDTYGLNRVAGAH